MRKRRGNNEGSIYQRADGRWCCTITVGYDAQGKRRRRTVFGKTKRDVREKLAELESKKADGTLGEPSKLSVAEYLIRWLEDTARPTIRATTHQNYGIMIRKHIAPRIGGVRLAKLTPAHVQGLYTSMERAGASPRLRQLTHAVLRRALSLAVRWNMVPRNVCDAVEPPRVPKRSMLTLTADQAMRFLEDSEQDRLHALYLLAISTGLRQGELLGLQWPDVDLERAALVVQRTLTEVDGQLSVNEPKSAKGRRLVALPRIAVEGLIEHRKRMVTEGFAGVQWVFCDTEGNPVRKGNLVYRSFRPILKRVNALIAFEAKQRGVEPELLPRIRFHDLRHTAATLMLADGIHPKIVQERLGHSTISMTLDTYSHVLPSMQREAADKMDRLLRRRA